MTPEQIKATSHEFLASNSIQINASLPFIEAIDDLHPQDAQSVARRIVVLNHVAGIGFGADPKKLKKFLEESSLIDCASENEKRLLSATEHTQQEKINTTWLVECIQSFAWCLGLVKLNPLHRCDNDLASHFPRPFSNPDEFISTASLRPLKEIYQQVDLHYRLHWAARNARLMGHQFVTTEGLISERRKALDWTIGVEQDWDEIPLDT